MQSTGACKRINREVRKQHIYITQLNICWTWQLWRWENTRESIEPCIPKAVNTVNAAALLRETCYNWVLYEYWTRWQSTKNGLRWKNRKKPKKKTRVSTENKWNPTPDEHLYQCPTEISSSLVSYSYTQSSHGDVVPWLRVIKILLQCRHLWIYDNITHKRLEETWGIR